MINLKGAWLLGIILTFELGLAYGNSSQTNKNERPNVVFLIIDDLRPELGVYGADHISNTLRLGWISHA